MTLLTTQQQGEAEFNQIISFLENGIDRVYFQTMANDGCLVRSLVSGYEIHECSFKMDKETETFNEIFVMNDEGLLFPYVYCVFE